MRTMSETKFPRPQKRYDDSPIFKVGSWNYYYDAEDIHNWFKCCLEDFPKYPIHGHGEPWSHREYEAWFKKWFSQFIEKGEEK